MIRVKLPYHLRNLARVPSEIQVDVSDAATIDALIDAIETRYPMLKGTIREHDNGRLGADGPRVGRQPLAHRRRIALFLRHGRQTDDRPHGLGRREVSEKTRCRRAHRDAGTGSAE